METTWLVIMPLFGAIKSLSPGASNPCALSVSAHLLATHTRPVASDWNCGGSIQAGDVKLSGGAKQAWEIVQCQKLMA